MNSFFESVVPCCMGLGFFILLFGFIAFMRYMGYRETLALAEKGLIKPERRPGNATLFWGIGFATVGLALVLGLLPIGFIAGTRFPFGLGPWLLVGLLPMFFGLGLVIFYVLTHGNAPVTPVTPVAPVVPVNPVGPVAPVLTSVAPVVVTEPVPTVITTPPMTTTVPPIEPPLPPAEPPASPAP